MSDKRDSQGDPRISVRFPPEKIAELKKEAEQRGISLSDLIREKLKNE